MVFSFHHLMLLYADHLNVKKEIGTKRGKASLYCRFQVIIIIGNCCNFDPVNGMI